MLFSGKRPWVKKGSPGMFDVTMGSYTMELKSVNLLAFSSSASSQRYSVKTTWVFQRRRLVCIKEYYWETVRKSEKIVSKIIDNFALKITAQANLQIVHSLDVTFIKQAYRKRTTIKPWYIDIQYNHPL